jgi:putative ABC transport system ATP-binding protein
MFIFDELHAEGQTIIIVTHEDHIAQRCHRVIKLMDGGVVLDASRDDRVMASAIGTPPGAPAPPRGPAGRTAEVLAS